MTGWWLPLIIQLDRWPSSSKPAGRPNFPSESIVRPINCHPKLTDMSLSSADLNLVTKCFGQMMVDLVGVGWVGDDDLGH